MRERNYTIPINESFEQKDGCAVCRLYAHLEKSSLEYAISPAMMEPDVRMETNKHGFCPGHYQTLLTMKNRLSLALTLETRVQEVVKALEKLEVPRKPDGAPRLSQDAQIGCYICKRVERFFQAYISNILFLWDTEPDFKALFAAQPEICLPHTARLLQACACELGKKDAKTFAEALSKVVLPHAKDLSERVSRFCKSFDHRFTGQDLGHAKTAAEDAIRWLSGV
jgi:hypothetical protein